MRLKLIKQNAFEIKELKESLEQQKKHAEKRLLVISEKLDVLTEIINDNNNSSQNWMVVLPSMFIENNDNEEGTHTKHNWKKIAMKLLSKYDMPMTSELMYNKAINQIAGLPDNRRFVLKNFSSALHYLAERDNILIRKKISGTREYLYALKHQFDDRGNIAKQYLEKFYAANNGI